MNDPEPNPNALEFGVALLDWLQAHVEGFEGPLTVLPLLGGQSNPTYRLVTPRREYVLRHKPPGELLRGAHAVDREARVMQALRGTGVPVPIIHGLCLDEEVVGSWFYVMDFVEGRGLRDARFPEVDPPLRSTYQLALVDALASLHRLDPATVGLQDFGKGSGYIGRQIERWSRQYLEEGRVSRNADMDQLVKWLPAHLPAQDEVAIVHGDFRIDNTLFHSSEPRLAAVLDWELSTLGHPVADFAYHAMMYRFPPEILGGIAGENLTSLGLLDEQAYVAAYCERTGRHGIPDLDFHLTFNMFRFAAILHGIRGRLARGAAAAPSARETSDLFERVAGLAWEQAKQSALS